MRLILTGVVIALVVALTGIPQAEQQPVQLERGAVNYNMYCLRYVASGCPLVR